MKFFLFNHKYQAFYISFLVFLPLIFFVFYSLEVLKIEPQSDENAFTLTIKQFAYSQNVVVQNSSQTPENTQKFEEVLPENSKPFAKKHKKQRTQKQIKPLVAQNVQNQNTQIQTPTTKGIENLSYGKDKNPFLEELQRIISSMRDYPPFARKMHMQGIVMVQFVWLETKKLSELKIMQSSGHKILDESALNTIKKASAYFPAYNKDVRISVPISYTLKR